LLRNISYQPATLIREFLERYPTETIPLTLVLNSEEYEIRRYLDKFRVRYFAHPYHVLFNAHGQAYIVTAFADTLFARLAAIIPQLHCAKANSTPNYHNILFCESAAFESHP